MLSRFVQKASQKLNALSQMGLAPEIMKNIFPIIENPYDLRSKTKKWFKTRNVHTVRYGTETASFVAPRILEPDSKKLQRM